jgi:glycolate oxidase
MTNPELIAGLKSIVGERSVLWREYDLMLYEYDGSIDKACPSAVIMPSNSQQVSEIVKLCNHHGVPFTARGAGTGLSGGCLPEHDSALLVFSKMNRILEVDAANMRAVVEPGVVNLHLSDHTADLGLYFVPDPSSQKACTIGGNVGENSGGPHTLIYGVTTNHVLGLEVVLPDGEIINIGGKALDAPGYDLVGMFVGSEGTLGIVTKITVKLTPLPEAVKTLLADFETVADASTAVSDIIESGVVPAALEMMDNLSIRAVERSVHAGYPTDAGAVLLIEVEGLRETVSDLVESAASVCRRNNARQVRIAGDGKERNLLWAGRKGAFGAMGRLSPDYYVMDGVVPRNRLPEVLAGIEAVSQKYGLRIANVFHAGDGNLHPLVLWNSDHPGEELKVRDAGVEVLDIVARVGGALTGEHGIGVEKRDMMGLFFSEDDITTMSWLKQALDPDEICNPGKLFPTPGRCIKPRPGRLPVMGW